MAAAATLADASPWRTGPLALLARLRPNVADLSARAEAAVLTPHDPGGWPADWRLDVAAGICDMNALPARAAAYRALASGPAEASARLDAGRAFAERVAGNPAAVTAAEVAALADVGIRDADIVRLCELVAFVSYQCRVEAGHALLEAAE